MGPGVVGIFDSGVGGLSVLREVRELLPAEDILYLADQAHVPYGLKPVRQVRGFAEEITRFLLARGAKVVVVACNTASAAALYHLRAVFPQVPFVGMEPAVKPAAQQSRTRAVGVIATRGTFQGSLFEQVVRRFAGDVRVIAQACPGLVEQIEKGDLDGPQTRALLEECLRPLQAECIDVLVLGCTHFPFASKAIRAILGPKVLLVDPAPAVARQVRRVLEESHRLVRLDRVGRTEYFTSGASQRLAVALRGLLGEQAVVQSVCWARGGLSEAPEHAIGASQQSREPPLPFRPCESEPPRRPG